METPGIPLTRWFDAVLLPKDQVAQKDNVRAMFVQGHASNSITRIPESLKGMAKLDLLVIADPHPTTWASLSVEAGRKDGTYLLPVCTQFESSGSRVASNRSLQWGEQIVKPIFESKDDYQVLYLMAKKLGFADLLFKNIKVEGDRPVARGHPARDQSRQLVDRLLRPIARAPQAAHGEPGGIRSGHDARAKDGPAAAATITACRGRAGARRRSSIRARRCFTTPISPSWTAAAHSAPASASSATGVEPARRRLLSEGFGDQGRLSRIHLRACSRSSAGTAI